MESEAQAGDEAHYARTDPRTLIAACLLLPLPAALGSGGVGVPDPSEPQAAAFGERVLRVGMTGSDVRVLNVLVRSKPYAPAVRLSTTFEPPTRDGVRLFQERRGLRANGVVNEATADELVRTMGRSRATWYGPGSTATPPPAARSCGPALSASPTRRFPAAPSSRSPTGAASWSRR